MQKGVVLFMIYLNNLESGRLLFDALSSPTRMKIIELLQNCKYMNMDTLAKSLNISNGALTSHMKKLSDCGLVNIKLHSIGHGTQKLCSIAQSKIVIDLIDKTLSGKFVQLEFNVGQFSRCSINPTCGLCDKEQPLFDFDIPHFFMYPERFNAQLMWFTDGFVSYSFPNPLKEEHILTEIQLSFELAGEGPFIAKDYPTAIDFFNGNSFLGRYDCPGEFDDHRGKFTPEWWSYGQYGELITISISRDGTFINGLDGSDYNIDNLLKDSDGSILIDLVISCQDRTSTKGGITLFGKDFGDYPQGIVMKAFYETKNVLQS